MSKAKQPPPDMSYIPDPWLRSRAVPLSSITLDPKNERKHDRANIDSIKGNMRRFGVMEPIGTRNGVVIRGNGTSVAMSELAEEKATALPGGPLAATLPDPNQPLDWAMVPVIAYEHLSEGEAAAWRVSHNRSAELGKWDWEKLQETLRETEVEWTDLGWEPAELDLLCQANWEPPAIPDSASDNEPTTEIHTAGDAGSVLILKLEGGPADKMRELAEAQDVTPAELLASWVKIESAQ